MLMLTASRHDIPARRLPTARAPDFHALDTAIARAIAERRIVGTVVLVAHEGRVVHRCAAGLADREAGVPMREDAIFLLASVTKPMVTVAALRLAEQGALRLDDPVTRWLPDFRPRLANGDAPVITLHQLLTHTAGLSYDFMQPADGAYRRLGVSSGLDRPGLGLAENLRRIAAAPLDYTPGTAWGYSVALDVLGAVLERVTGKPLPQVLREWVTGPLAMHDTNFAVRDAARLVAHYGDGMPEPVRMSETQNVPFNGVPVSFAPGRIFDAASFPSGGAGMAGTAGDFLRFAESLRSGDGKLLGEASLRAIFHAHVGPQAQTRGPGWGFGYGGALLLDPQRAASPQSAGTLQWGGAYGHHWFIDRQRALTVVAFTNTAFEGMVGAFTGEVRDAVYAALATV